MAKTRASTRITNNVKKRIEDSPQKKKEITRVKKYKEIKIEKISDFFDDESANLRVKLESQDRECS